MSELGANLNQQRLFIHLDQLSLQNDNEHLPLNIYNVGKFFMELQKVINRAVEQPNFDLGSQFNSIIEESGELGYYLVSLDTSTRKHIFRLTIDDASNGSLQILTNLIDSTAVQAFLQAVSIPFHEAFMPFITNLAAAVIATKIFLPTNNTNKQEPSLTPDDPVHKQFTILLETVAASHLIVDLRMGELTAQISPETLNKWDLLNQENQSEEEVEINGIIRKTDGERHFFSVEVYRYGALFFQPSKTLRCSYRSQRKEPFIEHSQLERQVLIKGFPVWIGKPMLIGFPDRIEMTEIKYIDRQKQESKWLQHSF